MIGEIPDPDCNTARKSGYAERYRKVRAQLMKYEITHEGTWHFVEDGIYRIVGVGFVDFPHGETGKAPNNIELHPILSIERVRS